jgi:hypothetical protein
MIELDELLKKTGLSSADDSANTIFSQIVNLFRRVTNPKSAEFAAMITPDGLPVIAPKVELGDEPGEVELVRHDDALRLLNDVLMRWATRFGWCSTAWTRRSRASLRPRFQPSARSCAWPGIATRRPGGRPEPLQTPASPERRSPSSLRSVLRLTPGATDGPRLHPSPFPRADSSASRASLKPWRVG